MQRLLGVGRETTTTLNDWTLPLRRRADALLKDGRMEEAAELLVRIRTLYRHGEQPRKPGGTHEPIHPERRSEDPGHRYTRV
ncbi:MAG TPA: hypothetical protein VLJ37_09990 [bacterium]|nr:hypothetical protein [bacterium]